MKCPRCAGTLFRADRALAGKLICKGCGLPFNLKNGRSNRGGPLNSYRSNRNIYFAILVIFLILIIVTR